MNVYTRIKGGQWDIKQCQHHIPVSNTPIQCFCCVDTSLWIGVNNSCVLLDMISLKLEHSIKVTSTEGVSVKRLTKSGTGVWIGLSKGATLFLYHKDTKKPIQEIDIKGSLANVISCANIQDKFDSLSVLHITSLMASSGYLWIGLSGGAVLIYRIPHFEHGLPLINGKPFLASDGHKGSVRVLAAVQTKLDMPSGRFDQFISEEKERMIGYFNSSSSIAKPYSKSTTLGRTSIEEVLRSISTN